MSEIKLTKEEAKILKQVVFRNHFADLDPIYRKVADREVNGVHRNILKNIELGVTRVGAHTKSGAEIINENLKDYRGIIKAVGFDSPSKKFKDILALNTHTKNVPMPSIPHQPPTQ